MITRCSVFRIEKEKMDSAAVTDNTEWKIGDQFVFYGVLMVMDERVNEIQ